MNSNTINTSASASNRSKVFDLLKKYDSSNDDENNDSNSSESVSSIDKDISKYFNIKNNNNKNTNDLFSNLLKLNSTNISNNIESININDNNNNKEFFTIHQSTISFKRNTDNIEVVNTPILSNKLNTNTNNKILSFLPEPKNKTIDKHKPINLYDNNNTNTDDYNNDILLNEDNYNNLNHSIINEDFKRYSLLSKDSMKQNNNNEIFNIYIYIYQTKNIH